MARKQRLPHDAYGVVGSTWHVTVNVDRRCGAPFADRELGRLFLTYWVQGCQKVDAVPHLVCFMPDHVHSIVEVGNTDLIETMRRLKSHSTAVYRAKRHSSVLWQQSFHDHGLRERVDFDAAAEYILSNPVRSGLVEKWEDYPLLAGDYLEGYDPKE